MISNLQDFLKLRELDIMSNTTIQEYKNCLQKTKESLLNSDVSLFDNKKYREFFDNENKLVYSINVSEAVKEYHSLGFWSSLWWRLTKPVDEYFILNDIRVLTDMESYPVSKGISLYDEFSLKEHIGIWDWVSGSLRYELNKIISIMREKHSPEIFNIIKGLKKQNNDNKERHNEILNEILNDIQEDIKEINNGRLEMEAEFKLLNAKFTKVIAMNLDTPPSHSSENDSVSEKDDTLSKIKKM